MLLYKHRLRIKQYFHKVEHKEIYGEKEKLIFELHSPIKLYLKALVSLSIYELNITMINIRIFLTDLVGKSWEGDISLDDLKLNFGTCPPSDICTFEHGLCDGWEKGSDGDFEWSRGRNGSTPTGTPTIG